MADAVLLEIFPYLAVGLAVAVGVYRYFSNRFSYSSLSSQFLENRKLFWGSVTWHYGIIIVLAAHLLAALFPGAWGVFFGAPARLYFLEVTGLALGLLSLVGLGLLLFRRLGDQRIKATTSSLDWLLLAGLLLQVASGVYIALAYRWGSAWYLQTAVPWLHSLVRLAPRADYLAALPWPVKLHLVNAFVLVALLPFTRLVHMFTVPVGYLWRPYQVVNWKLGYRPAELPIILAILRRQPRPPAVPPARQLPPGPGQRASGR